MRILASKGQRPARRFRPICHKQMRQYVEDRLENVDDSGELDVPELRMLVDNLGCGLTEFNAMEPGDEEVTSSTEAVGAMWSTDPGDSCRRGEVPVELDTSDEVSSSEIPPTEVSMDEVDGFSPSSWNTSGSVLNLSTDVDDISSETTEIISLDLMSQPLVGTASTARSGAAIKPRGLFRDKSIHDEGLSNCKVTEVETVPMGRWGKGLIEGAPMSWQPVNQNGDYEVEAIREYDPDKGGRYLIKWKQWPESFNTWEPAKNLHSCEKVLTEFYHEQREAYYAGIPDGDRAKSLLPVLPPDPRPLNEIIAEFLDAFPASETDVREFIARHGVTFTRPHETRQKLSKLVAEALWEMLPQEKLISLHKLIVRYELFNVSQLLQTSLKAWKSKLNRIAKGKPVIEVENTVDLEDLPSEFAYINESHIRCDIERIEPTACECRGHCFQNKSMCTSGVEGSQFAYNHLKRVQVPPGYPIFECHNFCQCIESCPNRVVGDGYERLEGMSFCIFKTTDKGWGVKTLKSIRKGTFVMLIVGEVVTSEQATIRQLQESPDVGKYVFGLESFVKCNYSIDFTRMGNLSRFINHSCTPNLDIYPNWLDHNVGGLPRIALFAAENIHENTELTYSYVDVESTRELTMNMEGCPQGFSPCHCDSPSCVRFMVFAD